MRQPRFQFTIGRLMIAIALIGIGLYFLPSAVAFWESPSPLGIHTNPIRAKILLLASVAICNLVIISVVFLQKSIDSSEDDDPEVKPSTAAGGEPGGHAAPVPNPAAAEQ